MLWRKAKNLLAMPRAKMEAVAAASSAVDVPEISTQEGRTSALIFYNIRCAFRLLVSFVVFRSLFEGFFLHVK